MMLRSLLLLLLLSGHALASWAQEPGADARRHLVRGLAAIEMAKSDADLSLAASEFQKATEIEPGMAAAWFNLAQVQARRGNFSEAIAGFQRYLELAPNAEDAGKVADDIIKLEFRAEVSAKETGRAGIWRAPSGTLFRLNVDGSRLTLFTDRAGTGDFVESTYTLVGKVPVHAAIAVVYRLEARGNELRGTWSRAGFTADKCTVPEEAGEVSGELNDAEGTIVLRHKVTKYRANTQLSVMTNDFCSGVSVLQSREVEIVYHGPVPMGRIGARIGSEHGRGKKKVTGDAVIDWVADGGPAGMAGLQPGDLILSVDGVPTAGQSREDLVWKRIAGEPGSEVVLQVQRRDVAEPLQIHVTRAKTEADLPARP